MSGRCAAHPSDGGLPVNQWSPLEHRRSRGARTRARATYSRRRATKRLSRRRAWYAESRYFGADSIAVVVVKYTTDFELSTAIPSGESNPDASVATEPPAIGISRMVPAPVFAT